MKKLTPLFGCALLCAPAPAMAQTSGGKYASAPAAIEAVTCRSECVDEDTARGGSVVGGVGREMNRVRKVTFLGGRGDGDDRTVPVLRWSRRIADVRVPDGALSGRVRVRNGDGAPSKPSADSLTIRNVLFTENTTATLDPSAGNFTQGANFANAALDSTSATTPFTYVPPAPRRITMPTPPLVRLKRGPAPTIVKLANTGIV